MAWNPLLFSSSSKPSTVPPFFPPPPALPALPALPETPFAVFGAISMQVFFPARETYNIDLLVYSGDYQQTRTLFRRTAIDHASYSHSHDFFRFKRYPWTVSLIRIGEDWVPPALAAAQAHRPTTIQLPSLPFHWLVLSKLWSARRQDFMDCARLIARATPEQLAQTRATLEEYLPSALHELRTLYRVGLAEKQQSSGYCNFPNTYSAWHQMNADTPT